MHCILLGVTKRLLCYKEFGWVFGKPPIKLREQSVNEVNSKISNMIKFIPCEFNRKPRSIIDCKRFKATEFRLLLLYTGPVLFKDILKSSYYHNFLCLSLATRILCNQDDIQDLSLLSFANDLLKHFIMNCKHLYKPYFITHNVHNLLHIVDWQRSLEF